MYFGSGWVNNAAIWEVNDKKFFIIKAKGSAKLANVNVIFLPNIDLGAVSFRVT